MLLLFLKARIYFASHKIQVPAPQRRTVYGQISAVFHFSRPIQSLLKWKHKSRHPSTHKQSYKRCTSRMHVVLPPSVNFSLRDFRNIVSYFNRKF